LLQGRGGDREIAHLTPGEMVIPRSLQTPGLMRAIAAEAARQGIDPARYTVGQRANRVNPKTGAREFNGCNPGDPGECFVPMHQIDVTGYVGNWPPIGVTYGGALPSGFGDGAGGGGVDDSGNIRIQPYEPCLRLSETEREGNPLCDKMIDPIKIKVLPAIPQKEDLERLSIEQLKAELAKAKAELIAAKAGETVLDKLLSRSPASWLGGQFLAKNLQDRLEDIVSVYEVELQGR
jgi:hypothetical protein